MIRKRRVLFSIMTAAFAMLALVGGCTPQALQLSAPYLPPAYYNCTEVKPDDLVFEYWNPHRDVLTAARLFDGGIFVFKSIEVDKNLLKNREDGFIWVSYKIRCEVVDIRELKSLKAGDVIDVVGINAGVANGFYGLEFADCYVLPAGLVKLPADIGGSFASGY